METETFIVAPEGLFSPASMDDFENGDAYLPDSMKYADGGLGDVLFNSHGVKVECIEEVLGKTFEDELVKDMLTLMASFSAKIYGKRSHQNRKKKEAEATKETEV